MVLSVAGQQVSNLDYLRSYSLDAQGLRNEALRYEEMATSQFCSTNNRRYFLHMAELCRDEAEIQEAFVKLYPHQVPGDLELEGATVTVYHIIPQGEKTLLFSEVERLGYGSMALEPNPNKPGRWHGHIIGQDWSWEEGESPEEALRSVLHSAYLHAVMQMGYSVSHKEQFGEWVYSATGGKEWETYGVRADTPLEAARELFNAVKDNP